MVKWVMPRRTDIPGQRKLQDDVAYPPRAMKVERGAAYLDMSRTKFLELVGQGRLPRPKIMTAFGSGTGLPSILPSAISRIAATMVAWPGVERLQRAAQGLTMATMRLRYVHSFVDRTGRVRFYFRHRGKRWPVPGEPGSAEFAASYDNSAVNASQRIRRAMLRLAPARSAW